MNMKNESGRSMVEMLGVLAVIGVLSVAGIAGYTTAMRSYRTNEALNAASMLYIMAMTKNQGNGDTTSYAEISDKNPSGVSALEYNKDTKAISITFNDKDDCIMALNKLGDKASANTCSATPATITVNFGEATTNNINLAETSGEDLVGKPCEQAGYYCVGPHEWYDDGYYSIVYCNKEGKNDNLFHYDHFSCHGTCVDHGPHDTPEGTCDGYFDV